MRSGAITTNYWVNDFGQRLRKTWNGSPASHVVFTYEPDGRHLGSYGLTGGVTEETVFLGDTPVGMMVGGVNYYVYADHLDAPRTVTNSSNQSRWEWDDADPFARTLPDQNPSGLGTFNWRRGFPGQFYDAEKSAWHNGFRTYHAAFGRYLQPDPIGLAGGDFSMYGYVGGNPVSSVDPYGLYSFDELVIDTGNATAGFTDSLTIGATAALRQELGINDFVDTCSSAYTGGVYSSLFAGAARLAYAGVVKGVSLLPQISAQGASEFRNFAKRFFRGPFAWSNYRIYPYEKLLAQNKGNAAVVKAKAGQTDKYLNAAGAAAVSGSAAKISKCDCKSK